MKDLYNSRGSFWDQLRTRFTKPNYQIKSYPLHFNPFHVSVRFDFPKEKIVSGRLYRLHPFMFRVLVELRDFLDIWYLGFTRL